jgi:hypothetical protein
MPVLRSGGFILYGYQLTNPSTLTDGALVAPPDPTSWHLCNTGVAPTVMPCDPSYTGPSLLDTTTEGNGWEAGAPPPGFTLHTAPLFAGVTLHPGFGGINPLNNDGTYQMGGKFGISAENSGFGIDSVNDDPLLVYIELLDFLQFHFTRADGFPFDFTFADKAATPSTPTLGARITGGYDIVAWWWIRTNPCLVFTRQSKLTLSIENPDVEDNWQKLDPNDIDAAPTPVIDDVTPNHGPIAGGTEITIVGSGFGTDCDVQVDGVSCTGIIYDSQYQVRATVPAHVAGAATVTLINADGVSS